MTKTLGKSFFNLYVMVVSKGFNVINPPKLLKDLEENSFIYYALRSVCCELYYKYGKYLAPFTAMLTTVKHINFIKNKNAIDENGDTGIPESSGTSETQKTHEPKTEDPKKTEEPQKRKELNTCLGWQARC